MAAVWQRPLESLRYSTDLCFPREVFESCGIRDWRWLFRSFFGGKKLKEKRGKKAKQSEWFSVVSEAETWIRNLDPSPGKCTKSLMLQPNGWSLAIVFSSKGMSFSSLIVRVECVRPEFNLFVFFVGLRYNLINFSARFRIIFSPRADKHSVEALRRVSVTLLPSSWAPKKFLVEPSFCFRYFTWVIFENIYVCFSSLSPLWLLTTSELPKLRQTLSMLRISWSFIQIRKLQLILLAKWFTRYMKALN